MAATLRLATPGDADAIRAIYAPFVESTAVSFEWEVPSIGEMASRIAKVAKDELPWLVATENTRLLGYAYASRHRDRKGYLWSVECSVYVDASARRKGVGRALYTALFEILRLQGYQNVYAGTTLPNESSIGIHKSFGFQELTVFKKVGYKFGRWHDVAWWHLTLGSHPEKAAAPLTLDRVVSEVLP